MTNDNRLTAYADGDLVRDTELNETFVYHWRTDGERARTAPQKLRFATEEEREHFRTKHPDTRFNN